MKLYRRPIFLCVFLLYPVLAAEAKSVPPCEVKEPSEWQTRIDKELAEREPAADEVASVERERVAAPAPLAVPTPLGKLPGDRLFREAYADVYRILSTDNECSRFYGGAFPASYVFNQLAVTFKSARIGGSRVAGRMDGGTMQVLHAPSGLSFRLFEQAVLNTAGAFYRRQGNLEDTNVPRVGRYAPDTRGARALILLHELGHVVRGAGGRWVLEDDGHDAALSERNTQLVEEHCGDELKALGTQRQRPRPAEAAKNSSARATRPRHGGAVSDQSAPNFYDASAGHANEGRR